ncbi:hypothetical protein Airi01_013200 [Actinoallomurus iriomotensis]|uniref:Uncharacterized protein n=3 Tax=Actinoallomurus TaxID=667113 RepID=A0A9W6RC22_9ACTN|nr:hypothetical protein Airi01_013200 [Actinoallomurus iriomotensis]
MTVLVPGRDRGHRRDAFPALRLRSEAFTHPVQWGIGLPDPCEGAVRSSPRYRARPRRVPAATLGAVRTTHLTDDCELGRMYFTDRGIEELAERRGEEEVSLAWMADRLREFVDLNPEFETPVERLATWLARLSDEDDD